MFSLKKAIVLIGIVFITVALLVGCLGGKTETQKETITVGAMGPLTGDATAYGTPVQRVVNMVVSDINEVGGVNGKTIEVIWEDAQCKGEPGATAAQKLINIDKVKFILGGFCSMEILGGAPVAEANKVIMLSSGASSPKVTDAGDFIFRNYPSDSSQGKLFAEHAATKGLTKIGVIAEQTDYAIGIADVFKKHFESLGGTVVEENFTSEATDLRTTILKIKGENPEALLISVQTPAKADIIFKQLQEQGVALPLYVNDVVAGFQDIVTKYKDYLEGMLSAEFAYDETHEGFQAFTTRYKEKYNEELPYRAYMATTYDAVYIMKEALERSEDDGEVMRDFLYGIQDRKGAAGSLTMDENGDPKAGHVMKTFKNGNVLLYTQ